MLQEQQLKQALNKRPGFLLPLGLGAVEVCTLGNRSSVKAIHTIGRPATPALSLNCGHRD